MNLFALLVWAAVLTGSALLIVHLRAARADRGGFVHDLSEAAFLIGGPPRVVDSALAALHSDGRIAVGGPGIVVPRPGAAPRSHVERAVLQELAAAPHAALHDLRLAVMRGPAVQEIGDALAARGLMVDPEVRRTGRRWCLALALVSFFMFIPAIVVTVAVDLDGFQVPFVFKVGPVLFAGFITGLVCGAYNAGRTTRGGRRAATAYQRDHVYAPDAGHQVALRGLRAVPHEELRTQLIAAARMPRVAHASSSSSSSASDVALLASLHWCAGTPGNAGPCGGASGGTGGGGGGTDSGFGGGGCSASACSGGSSGSSGSGGGGSSCSSGSSSGGSSCSSSSSSSSCGGGSSG